MTTTDIAAETAQRSSGSTVLPRVGQDRLSIAKLMWLTAGAAAGLTLFGAPPGEFEPANSQWWRMELNALLCGVALAGLGFALPRPARRRQAGSLFALIAGLGTLLLLPPAAIEAFRAASDRRTVVTCLYFVMPLMGLWTAFAALIDGAFARRRRRRPWTESFGLGLAACWSPLGVWVLVDIYREVL